MKIAKFYFLLILFLFVTGLFTEFLSEFKFNLNPISLAYQKESDKDLEILFRVNKVFNYERVITKFVF